MANPTWGYVIDASNTGQVNLLITIVPEARAYLMLALVGLGVDAGVVLRPRSAAGKSPGLTRKKARFCG